MLLLLKDSYACHSLFLHRYAKAYSSVLRRDAPWADDIFQICGTTKCVRDPGCEGMEIPSAGRYVMYTETELM